MASDYHMHIENGKLTEEYLNLYTNAACAAGLDCYGISEHLHNLLEGPALLKRRLPEGLGVRGWDTDEYIGLVKRSGARAGIEADYIPESENELRDYLLTHDFDYCIGSVHWIGDWVFDWSPEVWDGKNVEDAWRAYFKLAVKAVSTGMFDIFGHPDVIKVFGNKPGPAFSEELRECYRALARAAAATGTCLEVSSAGLRKLCGEMYPDISLLREAKLAGAEISLASDAHFPEHVGYGFDLVIAHAKAAGFDRAATFAGRKRTLVGI